MGYIDQNLLGNETVIVRGKNHPFIVIRPLVFCVVLFVAVLVGIGLMVGDLGGLAALVGLLLAGFCGLTLLGAIAATFGSVVSYFSDECAVTNKRVIGKVGLIRRSTLEFPFRQIESIAFNEGLLDRLVGAAQIRILGSGAAWVQTPSLSNSKQFRSAALEQMEALQEVAHRQRAATERSGGEQEGRSIAAL